MIKKRKNMKLLSWISEVKRSILLLIILNYIIHKQKFIFLTLCRYRTGHVPHSINLPHTDAFSSNGSLVDNPVVTSLMEQHYGKIIIVVANTNDPGPTVCMIPHNNTLHHNYYYVVHTASC